VGAGELGGQRRDAPVACRCKLALALSAASAGAEDLIMPWNAHCLFLPRLSPGKIAELERPRRHPKAFGTSSNLLSGTPSSVPCPPFRGLQRLRAGGRTCVWQQ